jgi:hypothetical protein
VASDGYLTLAEKWLTEENQTTKGDTCPTDRGRSNYSVQNLLPSRLSSKKWKLHIQTYDLCGSVWMWNLSLTSSKEHRLGGVWEQETEISDPKKDEMTGSWRKLYNAELHKLYPFPSIMRMITSRRMWRAEHVAQMEEDEFIKDSHRKAKRKETTKKTQTKMIG